MPLPTDLIDTRNAASRLALSVSTVVRMCRSRKLRAYRPTGPAGQWRISLADLEAYIAGSCNMAATPAQRAAANEDVLEQLRRKGYSV